MLGVKPYTALCFRIYPFPLAIRSFFMCPSSCKREAPRSLASLHVLLSLNWPENSIFRNLHLALSRIVRLRVDLLLEH